MERLLRWRKARKNYQQVVEFPVEIVGRDGQVRRFSFDESVRLYQRRVVSAALRYEGTREVREEVEHCQHRIEQLRRSYLEHFGWGPFRGNAVGSVLGTPRAAEVVAFLKRVFGEEPDGIASMLVTPVDTGVTDSCFVQTAGRSFLLYCWNLERAEAKAAYTEMVRRLAEAPPGEGVERLWVRWACADVAVLLTGTSAWQEGPPVEDPPVPNPTSDPWLDGIRALYEGLPALALTRLELGMESTPSRKVLSQTAGLVALWDDKAERAVFDVRTGLIYHPADPLLLYLELLALFRWLGPAEAQQRLAELRIEPGTRRPSGAAPLWMLAGLAAIERGAWVTAVRLLWPLALNAAEPRFTTRGARQLGLWMLELLLLGWVGLLLPWLLPGAALPLKLLLGGVALLLVLLPAQLLRRRVRKMLQVRGVGPIPLLSPDLFPRERRGEPAH